MKNYLYLIKLKENRYYVGSTIYKKRIETQINQNKKASQWIKINEIDSLIGIWNIGDLIYREAEVIETLVTFELMKLVGVLNVRGGFITLTNPDGALKTVISHQENNRFNFNNIKNLDSNFLKSENEYSNKQILDCVNGYLEINGIFSFFIGNDINLID